jgi:hypothetical protein
MDDGDINLSGAGLVFVRGLSGVRGARLSSELLLIGEADTSFGGTIGLGEDMFLLAAALSGKGLSPPVILPESLRTNEIVSSIL